MKHDELAHSLAVHLSNDRRMVWEDVPAGSSGSVRPDVFVMNKSFTKPNPITYEIKVSRSDYFSDVTSGKWREYLNFSDGVIFAVPKGLINKNELPDKCGLIVYNKETNMWRTQKRPILSDKTSIDSDFLLKLLMEGEQRQTNVYPYRQREILDWYDSKKLREKFGQELSEIIKIKKNKDEHEYLKQYRKNLCNVLDLPESASTYLIRSKVSHIKDEVEKLEKDTKEHINKTLNRAIGILKNYMK